MDTNPVENTIRTLTLNRMNALFADYDVSARTWARVASMIEACKLNAVDSYANLRETLTAIANGHTASSLDDLKPWAYQKPSIEKPHGVHVPRTHKETASEAFHDRKLGE